jgi:hypothetical protein
MVRISKTSAKSMAQTYVTSSAISKKAFLLLKIYLLYRGLKFGREMLKKTAAAHVSIPVLP